MDMWSTKHEFLPWVSIGWTWALAKSPLGLCAAHDGHDLGYSSALAIFPEQRMGVIMLINGDYADPLFELPWNIAWLVRDSLIKRVDVPIAYLKLVEGEYISTHLPNGKRKISFKVENGELIGKEQDYRYKLVPLGDGKFINPDDGASFEFDTKDKNAITLQLFRTIHLKKVN
jgi:hypothetical protein